MTEYHEHQGMVDAMPDQSVANTGGLPTKTDEDSGGTGMSANLPVIIEMDEPSSETDADPPLSVEDDGTAKPPEGFRLSGTGVEFLVVSKDGAFWELVCTPIMVVGLARTKASEDWSLLARLIDPDGVWHDVVVPFSELNGDGTSLVTKLLNCGLRLQPGPRSKYRLLEYLSACATDRRILLTDQCGWVGDAYVLPHKTYGKADQDVVLRDHVRREHRYGIQGTLEDWKSLAKLAYRNTRLILALCVALMGPLLRLVEREGGGFHFRGACAIGKTTLLILAGSIWGGGGLRGLINSWRLTDNAAEGLARQRNDGLLLLDEMGECEAAHLAAISYMLANGEAKGRSNVRGDLRSANRWVLAFLSTGEIGLADKHAEEGRGRKVRAGQEVRVIDIPADAGKGMGIIEELHGYPDSAALIRHITKTAKGVYGSAADMFLSELVENRDEAQVWVSEYCDWFVAGYCPNGADPQVRRVAERFALAAAAGELAVQFNVLPWDEGEATMGVVRCFEAWLEARGGVHSREEEQVLRQVLDILAKDGASRFEDFHSDTIVSDGARNRLGWRRKNRSNVWEYYATAEGFAEMHAGFDKKLAIEALVKRGVLEPGDTKTAKSMKVPGYGQTRVYHLCPHQVQDDPQD